MLNDKLSWAKTGRTVNPSENDASPVVYSSVWVINTSDTPPVLPADVALRIPSELNWKQWPTE